MSERKTDEIWHYVRRRVFHQVRNVSFSMPTTLDAQWMVEYLRSIDDKIDRIAELEQQLAAAQQAQREVEAKAALADRIREWFASGEEEDSIDFEAWCRDFDAVT